MNPEGGPHIQLPTDGIGRTMRPGGAAGPSDAQDTIPPGEPGRQLLASTAVFAAIVGLALGAVIGAACCWLLGEFDLLWQGVLVGVIVGPVAGVLLGIAERKVRGIFVRPDPAGVIGVTLGLVPAVLVGLRGMGGVTGRLSGYVLCGEILAGPMAGLFIGGIFDRAFEAALKKSWGAALPFATGVAICVGLVFLIDSAAYGPAPEEVAREAEALIALEWESNPLAPDARIHSVTVVRKGRSSYTGFADVTIAGQRGRRPLEAEVKGGLLSVRWTGQSRDVEAH
jgi:hypothetical protein